MTGLEKITNQIQEEAEASAREKVDAAKKEAEKILAEAKEACEAAERAAAEKAAALKETREGRAASSAEQQRRVTLLSEKQALIAEVIDAAYESLKSEDTESYFLTLESLLKTYALPGKGKLYFSAADLERMPAGFGQKMAETAKEKGAELTLMKEPLPIESGFVLAYGGIEENCSLKALFDAKRDELQDKVNQILFL